MTEQDDDIANAEREAHRGRPADAVPLLAKVVIVQGREIADLKTELGLLIKRVDKLERDKTCW